MFYDLPHEVRYSPDQPRDPDGKFASGGGEAKTAQKPARGLKQIVRQWAHGIGSGIMRDAAGKDLAAGRPNPLIDGINNSPVEDAVLYRGLASVLADSPLVTAKVGSECDMLPQSFTRDS